ncbi:MAG: patatin-like phospholipase family protein [Bacteroidales bacterium]|jgi:NTE family protein|nr:patatin-like phospholipase family protein [Bacteroidales bacterium]
MTRKKNKYWLLLIILFPFSVAGSDIEKKISAPKVGVVLSGGGAKGFAHIGVLKVLEEEGIPVDIIVGTSMGSLVGGVYSLGYNADEIMEIVHKIQWESLLSDAVLRTELSYNEKTLSQRYQLSLPQSAKGALTLPKGLVRGQNVINLFCGLTANVPVDADFLSFPIPYACVAANIQTGEEVVMTDGFLPEAMFASMAFPGFFHPMERNGKLLIDGGVVNNFPVDVAKNMGADIIIGVDVTGNFTGKEDFQSMFGILGQLVCFMGMEKDSLNKALCDITIRPDITGYSVASFNHAAADTLINRGIAAADSFREVLRKLKTEHGLCKENNKEKLVLSEKWKITKISISDDLEIDKSIILHKMSLEIPGVYSYEEIKASIDRLYGTDGFERVYFSLNDNQNGKTLNLNITPKKSISLNIGFKANTTDAAAVLLNATRKDISKTIGYFSSGAELSINPGVTMIAETKGIGFPTLGFMMKAKYQNYRFFQDGKKQFSSDIFHASASVYVDRRLNNGLTLSVGTVFDYFNKNTFYKSDYIPPDLKNKAEVMANGYISFQCDNLNNFYFPTRGVSFLIKYSIYTPLRSEKEFGNDILVNFRSAVPAGKRTTFLFDIYNRSLLNEHYPHIKSNLVGGEGYSIYFENHLPLTGMPPFTIAGEQATVLKAGVRFRLFKNHFLTFSYNELYQGNKRFQFNENMTIRGASANFALKTILGPIDVGAGLHFSKEYCKPGFSANLGLWF